MGQVIETLDHQVDGIVELEQREPGAFSNQSSTQKMSPEEWLKEWDELAEEVGKVWPAGLSAVDAISEERR